MTCPIQCYCNSRIVREDEHNQGLEVNSINATAPDISYLQMSYNNDIKCIAELNCHLDKIKSLMNE